MNVNEGRNTSEASINDWYLLNHFESIQLSCGACHLNCYFPAMERSLYDRSESVPSSFNSTPFLALSTMLGLHVQQLMSLYLEFVVLISNMPGRKRQELRLFIFVTAFREKKIIPWPSRALTLNFYRGLRHHEVHHMYTIEFSKRYSTRFPFFFPSILPIFVRVNPSESF